MNDSFEMELSLEHINPDLVDLPVEVEVEVYKGSTVGFTSDDPGELNILKVTVMEQRVYEDHGVKYTLYKGDRIHKIDSQMIDQIEERYAR